MGRRNKITLEKFDLSEITVYLAGRKKIFTEYRGHPVVLNPTTFTKREKISDSPFIRPNYVSWSIPGISLTLEANNTLREIVWSDNISEEEILEQLKRELFPESQKYELRGNLSITADGKNVMYQQKNIETDKDYLQFLFDMLVDLIEAYPSALALGGEAIRPLLRVKQNHDNILSSITSSLLRGIESDTKERLGANPSKFLCRRCLVRCGMRREQAVKYYGCRVCGQGRDVLEWEHPIIAVLDDATNQRFYGNDVIRENWLVRQTQFDFDEVEIVKATDEEIERFAVQVGNDTDEVRKSKYKQMRCVVSSDCGISENTTRILKSIFGQVEETVLTSTQGSLSQ